MECTNGKEELVFLIAKVFILVEITVTLRGSASEMPLHFNMQSSYMIVSMIEVPSLLL
jgi:hypothetical protein